MDDQTRDAPETVALAPMFDLKDPRSNTTSFAVPHIPLTASNASKLPARSKTILSASTRHFRTFRNTSRPWDGARLSQSADRSRAEPRTQSEGLPHPEGLRLTWRGPMMARSPRLDLGRARLPDPLISAPSSPTPTRQRRSRDPDAGVAFAGRGCRLRRASPRSDHSGPPPPCRFNTNAAKPHHGSARATRTRPILRHHPQYPTPAGKRQGTRSSLPQRRCREQNPY